MEEMSSWEGEIEVIFIVCVGEIIVTFKAGFVPPEIMLKPEESKLEREEASCAFIELESEEKVDESVKDAEVYFRMTEEEFSEMNEGKLYENEQFAVVEEIGVTGIDNVC
jgi:hypothetical protein